jgi:molecular chaperone GrpE
MKKDEIIDEEKQETPAENNQEEISRINTDAAEKEQTESRISDENTVEKLRKEITELQEQLDHARDRMLRMAADFENYKKRIEREKLEFVMHSNESVVKQFLPVYDNLLRALEHKDKKENKDLLDELINGIGLIQKQFMSILEKMEIEIIHTEGEMFNPSLHEAFQIDHRDDVPEDAITREVQKGFVCKNRLIRPALVCVARNPLINAQETSISEEVKIEESEPSPAQESSQAPDTKDPTVQN